jgi:hypothetical protein
MAGLDDGWCRRWNRCIEKNISWWLVRYLISKNNVTSTTTDMRERKGFCVRFDVCCWKAGTKELMLVRSGASFFSCTSTADKIEFDTRVYIHKQPWSEWIKWSLRYCFLAEKLVFDGLIITFMIRSDHDGENNASNIFNDGNMKLEVCLASNIQKPPQIRHVPDHVSLSMCAANKREDHWRCWIYI